MKRQSFLKGSAVLLVMVLITKIIGLIYKVKLTSMLGGSGMSCYSGAFAVFTPIFAAAASGAPGAMSRLVSEQLALGRYKSARKIRRTALIVFSAISLMLSVGLIMGAETLAKNVIGIPEAKWAVIGISLSLFPAGVMNVQRGWAEGLGSMTPTATSEIAETFGKLIFGIAGPFAVLQYAADSYRSYGGCFGHYCADMREAMIASAPYAAAASALGVSAASSIACIFLFLSTRRLSKDCANEFRSRSLPLNIGFRAASSRLMKYAVPASLTAVVATLAGMADLVTITPRLNAAMKSSHELFSYLGAYGIDRADRAGFVYGSYTGLALTIFGLVPTFTAMLGKSVLPSLTAAFARGDRAEAARSVRSVLLLSAAIAMPSGLGVCLLSKPILALFFAGSSAEISVSAAPLSILGIGIIFMGISLPCLTALQACDRQLAAVGITLAGSALKLLLNIVFIAIPSLNICGAALSTAISQAVMCAASVGMLICCSGAGAAAVRSLFTPLLPAFLCGCTAILVQQNIVMSLNGIAERLGVLFSITIGAIICAVSFALLCISPKNQILSLFLKKISKTT